MADQSTMAEFAIRVVKGEYGTKTQLIVNNIPVRETLPKPLSLTGNEDFQNMFTLILNAFQRHG